MTIRKPLKRGHLRQWAGIQYYQVRRYMKWLAQWPTFSTKAEAAALPHVIASHQTPLLRQLAAVDMLMQHNKIINLRLACGKLNGIVIEPGQRFSYWCLIGKPTRRKGYVEGMGRLCQAQPAASRAVFPGRRMA